MTSTKLKETSVIQLEIKTDTDWESFSREKGLWLVDVHRRWCGPCAAIHGLLKKIKIELGDDSINYASVEVDGVESLREQYVSCKPLWFFYHDGQRFGEMQGADAQLLTKLITLAVSGERHLFTGVTNVTEKVQERIEEERLTTESP